jgi:hypothetical protein
VHDHANATNATNGRSSHHLSLPNIAASYARLLRRRRANHIIGKPIESNSKALGSGTAVACSPLNATQPVGL